MRKHAIRFTVGFTVLILGVLLLLYQPIFIDSANADDQVTTSVMINGLNTSSLSGLVDMLKKDSNTGRTTFYSNSWWQHGMRSFTSFSGYKIDGKMYHEKTRNFVLLGDEGVELSGTDAAPGAVEEMMYAMGTCVIAAGNANAAFMGVKLTRFEVALECDLDLHGLFALDEKVRPGIQNLRTKITIAGDADEETLIKIATLGFQYSPVSETVRNGVSAAATPEITVVN